MTEPYEPPMVTVVPEHVAAFASGLYTGGTGGAEGDPWSLIAQVAARVGLGTWNPVVLQEAAYQWGRKHLAVQK
jgi:hypothetical protein